jgi:hypothetical protein
MRNAALVIGIISLVGCFNGCVNDPTKDETVMSSTDTDSSSEEVVDTDTETVIDSGTETAE